VDALIAAGVDGLGLGRRMTFDSLDATAFAEFLRTSFTDNALIEHARAAAPDFRARGGEADGEDAASAIELLL
jgi:hypothetical protein